MLITEKQLVERKIVKVEEIIDAQIAEMVRLELLLKNEEIAVEELPENAARDKAFEELTARRNRYADEIEKTAKSIEVAELLAKDYKEQLKK